MKHFNFFHMPHASLDCYLLEGNQKTFVKDLQGMVEEEGRRGEKKGIGGRILGWRCNDTIRSYGCR